MNRFRLRLSTSAVPAAAGLAAILLMSAPAALAQHEKHQHHHARSHASASGEAPRPVVGAHELMELFNQPLYEELNAAMQQVPSGDEQWEKIAGLGSKAAEIANLVALRETDRPEEWRAHATAMQQAGVSLAEAANAKNFEAARQSYTSLVERCNVCHKEFAPEHAPTLEP